jgi:hypothetical protein
MGPQPAAALPVLALRPDKAAEHKCSEQTTSESRKSPTAKECRKAIVVDRQFSSASRAGSSVCRHIFALFQSDGR